MDDWGSDTRANGVVGEQLVLDLGGYEGPLDLLLSLSRAQKVDLTKISILRLADQYLDFIQRMRGQLDLAAEYLVMAAWLAYLKSRLLLPEPEPDDEEALSPSEMAELLAFRLQQLAAMQRMGAALLRRPQLGRDFYDRGMPETLGTIGLADYELSLVELLRCYGDFVARNSVTSLTIEAPDLYSVDDALQHLQRILGKTPGWSILSAYIPAVDNNPLLRKSAVASTFIAALELARQGRIQVRQDGGAFAPIYVQPLEVSA